MNYREHHRLLDIQRALDAIDSHVSRADLHDGLVFDAVRMRIVEIGEAVKSLPEPMLVSRPEIEWAEIARMRDHLAHRYFDTTFAVVADVISHDVGPLRTAVEALLAGLPAEEE